jgi:hypothetical protein
MYDCAIAMVDDFLIQAASLEIAKYIVAQFRNR